MSYIQTLLIGSLLAFTSVSLAAEPINSLDRISLLGGFEKTSVAIRGYDTVAYFTESKSVEGSKAITKQWKGAIWRFATTEHRDMFAADPERYAPRYGGYCAYGVAAQERLVKIEPDLWTIVDGKLYLNYNDEVQKRWEQDIEGHIAEADANFDKLLVDR